MDLPQQELQEDLLALALSTPTPTPKPTASPLEKLYGIPEGWHLVQADEIGSWATALDGLYFALPNEWTCHDLPDDSLSSIACILDESADRFENQRKTTLSVSFLWWSDATDTTKLSEFVSDVEDGRAFYGYTCESNSFTIDGLQAATVACTNPEYDDQIDYDKDRDAYGEATSQIPIYKIYILNGNRIESFQFRTWDKSQMPSLFESFIPYIHYDDVED
ncbi:MAG: hypothetical protein KKD28_10040 [Chloroflexi bacterium]|nr:hypothetical protein [Chloroflexota bacterium]MBU1661798.1 hypothetical protein [Chloroflexota bacterium]